MTAPRLNETRKHTRYKANEGIVALSFEDVCKLMDISEGGAAVTCIGKSEIPPKFSLDILMKEHKFHTRIPVKLVWESAVEHSAFSSIFTKNIGVEFDNLTGEEKKKIDYLLLLQERN